MHQLPFRQVHLDFHTSGAIPGIGSRFDAAEWVATLRAAHVNSITLFAVCHHGWHYHDTAVGVRHPHLNFDLLRAQFDATKQAGINAPVYISAGLNQQVFERYPQWRVQTPEQRPGDQLLPGFRLLCFNTGYLDLLCDEIRETARLFPNADGIFLDIISKPDCLCAACIAGMARAGLNAADPADRRKYQAGVLDNYYRRTLAALREVSATMPIFQNSGNVQRGERRFFDYVSHLELESLPTGGWGYDHFPMSALAAAHSGLDYLGMTGKFHTTWGEFGGYKHPNALRYECAAMLAFGSKCSVGDQLHPSGQLDASTYRIIGAAYKEVAEREAWCRDTMRCADIAVLSADAVNHGAAADLADTGVCRLLLESHFLFDLIDAEGDFARYRLLILPDCVTVDAALRRKLDAYLARGGKLLLSGASGVDGDGKALFDIGGTLHGESEFSPDFLLPAPSFRPDWCQSPFVMYERSRKLSRTDGEALGEIFAPYFNREWNHFCSHQHTPPELEASGYVAGTRKGNVTYLAYPIFTAYRKMGAVLLRQFLQLVIADTLGTPTLEVRNLPSTGRVTLTEQSAAHRYVLHTLYAAMAPRGGTAENPAGITVIEDLPLLTGVRVKLHLPRPILAVKQQPAGSLIDFETAGDGTVTLVLPPFVCHSMVELSY